MGKARGLLFGRWFKVCDKNGIVAEDMNMLFGKYQNLQTEGKLPDIVQLHSSTYEMVMRSARLATNYTQPKPLYPVNGN